MVILNHRGIFGKLSHLTMKKLSKRTPQGLRGCRTSATGIVRVSEVNVENGRSEQADFASEALLSIIGKMNGELVDLHGVTLFVPHGSDWSEQVNSFLKDPEQYEAVHPRMVRPETSYLYFARDVFFREVQPDDQRRDPADPE